MEKAVYVVLVVVALTVIVGPFLGPNTNQSHIEKALQPPSWAHLFGTDDQGRDVFWRVVAGTRISVLSALLVVIAFALISVVVATLATMGWRWLDAALRGACDVGLGIPPMLIALGFAAALGASLRAAIIAMILSGWTISARLLRGVMHETRELPFVEGAQVLGASRRKVLLRHVLPNSLDVLVVKWSADIGAAIVVLAGLSFIGVGAQPPSPEWGAMIANGQAYVATAWWTVAAPGAALIVTASAFALLGEILQTRLDPVLKQTT